MKRNTNRAFLSLFSVGVFLCFLISNVGAVFAATPFDPTQHNFVNALGQTDFAAPNSKGRFVFVDPFSILDTVTKKSYVTSATTCGADKMFDCQQGQSTTILRHRYFYWPTADGKFPAPVNGACLSGLEFDAVPASDDGMAKFSIVNAEIDARGTGCQVKGDDIGGDGTAVGSYSGNTIIPVQDLEGWGVYQPRDSMRVDLGVDRSLLLDGATFLKWLSPDNIQTYNGKTLAKITSSMGAYQGFIDALNKHKETQKYTSGYDLYTTDNCINNQDNTIGAFVARSTKGDNSSVDVVPAHLNGGGYDFQATWSGDGMACLAESYSPSPAALWGGQSNAITIGIGDFANYANPDPTAGTTGFGSTQGGTSGSQDNSCESKGGVMGWLLCPVIELLDSGMVAVDALIQTMLNVDTHPFQQSALKSTWSNVRDLAYIITVPIMLVMVIGTALGFDFVSAYTVKKSLPRLVVAIIFISLSYQICTFLVDISNAVGQGTIGFLTSPFGNINSLDTLFTAHTNILLNIVLAPVKVVETIGAVLGLIGLLIWFAGPILLFASIGFITLLFRQLLIVFLVLIAPLAILAWVFPGNDKLWKTWWSLFSKLLIMYPLIMALLAAGHIFAYIIGKT